MSKYIGLGTKQAVRALLVTLTLIMADIWNEIKYGPGGGFSGNEFAWILIYMLSDYLIYVLGARDF